MSNSKFKLTAETKLQFGITLRRIRALKDITDIGVKRGDSGGWVERETNLHLYDNAWVSGNARTKHGPLVITGYEYTVTICDEHIIIGCECHTLAEWRGWDGAGPPRLWAAREQLFAMAEAHIARLGRYTET